MNKKLFFIIKLIIIVAMYLIGYLLLDRLPDMLPIHWNFKGMADNFWPKTKAVILLPSVTLGILILFHFLPKLDPKKEKYQQFAKTWEIFQFILIIFFAYIYFISLYLTQHLELSMTPFMLTGIGILFILLGNYMGKIRQNYFVGIKTPWTLNNEEVWNKTHRLGGWCFVIAGVIFLLEAYFQVLFLSVFIILIILCLVVPIVYSYLLHRKVR